ncbi:hypothetical protein, partial [Tahibacter caeni]|uniref:hypothetical protein n=1 Tax=Tahibacter caeni TaxID=1453545 RepID=UPI00214751CC
AQALAWRLGVPAATARQLIDLVIADAHRQHQRRRAALPADERSAATPDTAGVAATTARLFDPNQGGR